MALQRIAEEYFSTLNPIATRIYQDMEETKSSYEELWPNLSEDEQKQILSESIIKPEISIKYTQKVEKNEDNQYAVKLIIDDNCSYRDEHSGPFTFKTKSQRDLSLFEKSCKPMMISMTESKFHKPKANYVIETKELYAEEEDVSSDNGSTNALLPKTGLDFLDNW